MPWYHVCISFWTGKTTGSEVKLDLTPEELERRINAPYATGQPITINGKTIQPEDIERVRVRKTEEDSTYFRPAVEHMVASRPFRTAGAVDYHIANNMGDDVSDEFIVGPPGQQLVAAPSSTPESTPPQNTRDVFVIHGRNAGARNALFDFLRAIDLHPVEWSEAVQGTGKSSPYIGEILDSAFSRAHAVVALFTPDDEARLREPYRKANELKEETQLRGQARPNVLFESGMALARHEDRTVLVELGDLRPFSDVAGRHAIRIDNSPGWRQDLAQRLETAGCPVRRTGNDWLTAGDFTSVLAELSSLPSQLPETIAQQSAVSHSMQLSEEALEILLTAAREGNGRIVQMNGSENALYRAGSQNFGDSNSARSQALWKRIIRELGNGGFIEVPNNTSQTIPLTDEGFRFVDSYSDALSGNG